MWLFTTDGFYSTVQYEDDPKTLLVRCRAKEDALNLVAWLADHDFGANMRHTPTADYEWRMLVPRHAWATYLADATKRLDYPNFKNAVALRQGLERADIYHDVWSIMAEFQEDNRG